MGCFTMEYGQQPHAYVAHLTNLMRKGCYDTVLRNLQNPPPDLGKDQLILLQEAAVRREAGIKEIQESINGLLDG